MTFQPGKSGNPSGRPPGSRNKLAEAFLTALHADFDANGKNIIEKCRAEKPDVYLRICAQVLPKDLRGDIQIELGDVTTAKGTAEALSRIVKGVTAGDISASEATDLANLVELQRRAIETQDLAERIARLEAQEGKR